MGRYAHHELKVYCKLQHLCAVCPLYGNRWYVGPREFTQLERRFLLALLATLPGSAVIQSPAIATPFIPIGNTMDPASAIIGIVSFGLTVFAKVNEVRKEINSAPEQVRALQQACIGVELLLSRLDTTAARTVPCPLKQYRISSACALRRNTV